MAPRRRQHALPRQARQYGGANKARQRKGHSPSTSSRGGKREKRAVTQARTQKPGPIHPKQILLKSSPKSKPLLHRRTPWHRPYTPAAGRPNDHERTCKRPCSPRSALCRDRSGAHGIPRPKQAWMKRRQCSHWGLKCRRHRGISV